MRAGQLAGFDAAVFTGDQLGKRPGQLLAQTLILPFAKQQRRPDNGQLRPALRRSASSISPLTRL